MAYEHDQDDIIPHMPFMQQCASMSGVIIEIGVGHGNGSTRAFARGLAQSRMIVKMHIGVDTDPERPQVKPDKYWHEVHGPSEDPQTALLVEKILEGRKADIIFIDTVHTHEHMTMELPIWSQFADGRTIWLFHDTNMFQIFNHMTVAIMDWAEAHPGWEFFEYALCAHGFGVMRWKGGPWSDIQPRETRPPA